MIGCDITGVSTVSSIALFSCNVLIIVTINILISHNIGTSNDTTDLSHLNTPVANVLGKIMKVNGFFVFCHF